ncbi:helix-turn-helix domain-containing protein [Ensifer sp. ENS02]|nr:helix-turn-helix domain-containing protein [Ensifer sp. ENS02]
MSSKREEVSVFWALAQAQTTDMLCAAFSDMDRCTVMQHLKVLEEADLIIVSRAGRERWNYLNALPIKRIHGRWISEHAAHPVTILDRLKPGMPEVRAALRSGLRYAAEEIVARDKYQQKLTPAKVALELGISVRQLHVLFEHAELTFARTLASMRTSQARRLLVERPALPVTEVAYACGFDSLARFYRLFTGAYGMAPGEFRAAGSLH